MTPDEQIRERIRRVMKAKGLTQKALADRLGIRQQSVSEILRGDRAKIPQSLLDILEVLEIEIGIVLEENKLPEQTHMYSKSRNPPEEKETEVFTITANKTTIRYLKGYSPSKIGDIIDEWLDLALHDELNDRMAEEQEQYYIDNPNARR